MIVVLVFAFAIMVPLLLRSRVEKLIGEALTPLRRTGGEAG